jgi:hypothetical protein
MADSSQPSRTGLGLTAPGVDLEVDVGGAPPGVPAVAVVADDLALLHGSAAGQVAMERVEVGHVVVGAVGGGHKCALAAQAGVLEPDDAVDRRPHWRVEGGEQVGALMLVGRRAGAGVEPVVGPVGDAQDGELPHAQRKCFLRRHAEVGQRLQSLDQRSRAAGARTLLVTEYGVDLARPEAGWGHECRGRR